MLHALHRRWSQWQTYRRIRRELLTYRERELHDMGIGPGDIDRVAWEGSSGSLSR